MQDDNLVIGGAMTDVKGDRSLSPSQQEDPDLFVHVSKETKMVFTYPVQRHIKLDA